MKTLILFSEYFPYELVDNTFIAPEIPFLLNEFQRLIIIPNRIGNKVHNLPANVEVVTAFARSFNHQKNLYPWLVRSLTSTDVFHEIKNQPGMPKKPSAIWRIIWTWAAAGFTRDWLQSYIRENRMDLSATLFYTYWFNHITLGIGYCKLANPGLTLVSRAHRYDLYEDQQKFQFIPFRTAGLKLVDRLFIISENGKAYLQNRYPWANDKYEVSRLGIKDPGFSSMCSQDDKLRVVSCSSLIPVKRVHLIMEGLSQLALSKPALSIQWDHFGSGPELSTLQGSLDSLPNNLAAKLWGRVPNAQIMGFYRDNPVDVFVNSSSSEGIPVSIMEAQSCGIPVIATAVDGTPEIVSDENGRLLGADPSPADIAGAVWEIQQDNLQGAVKRSKSKAFWDQHFNAGSNLSAFAKRLICI
jgi:glycosyltransferase involved in cell wall biosynthesis